MVAWQATGIRVDQEGTVTPCPLSFVPSQCAICLTITYTLTDPAGATGFIAEGTANVDVHLATYPVLFAITILIVADCQRACAVCRVDGGSFAGTLMNALGATDFDHTLERTLESKPDEAGDVVDVRRIELITGTGRRRRWSTDDKARILVESFKPGANVSEVARRHGISPQQLFGWRREFREPIAESGPGTLRSS